MHSCMENSIFLLKVHIQEKKSTYNNLNQTMTNIPNFIKNFINSKHLNLTHTYSLLDPVLGSGNEVVILAFYGI